MLWLRSCTSDQGWKPSPTCWRLHPHLPLFCLATGLIIYLFLLIEAIGAGTGTTSMHLQVAVKGQLESLPSAFLLRKSKPSPTSTASFPIRLADLFRNTFLTYRTTEPELAVPRGRGGDSNKAQDDPQRWPNDQPRVILLLLYRLQPSNKIGDGLAGHDRLAGTGLQAYVTAFKKVTVHRHWRSVADQRIAPVDAPYHSFDRKLVIVFMLQLRQIGRLQEQYRGHRSSAICVQAMAGCTSVLKQPFTF